MTYRYQPVLEHHGIKGQKWGVRRYQNADGSLTPKGEARYKKEVDKLYTKAAQQENSNHAYLKRWVNAYNQTAEYMNRKGIADYNSKHKPEDKDYESGMQNWFNEMMGKTYNDMLIKDIEKNKNYQKAREIVDKYGMKSIKSVRQMVEEEYNS